MKRKIIRIDHETCNGCGLCLPNCPEGALQLIDNKARLVSDLFCDGLGACIGTCPLGAIYVEEREAEPYDEQKVMANIVPQGENVIRAHLAHLAAHNEQNYLEQAQQFLRARGLPLPAADEAAAPFQGCPGSRPHDLRGRDAPSPASASAKGSETPSGAPAPSQLRTWPLQLHLLNPQASFFDDADLLIAADCVPFAYASFHGDFLQGKVPIVFCPKLDHANDQYLAKLTAILQSHPIRSLHIVHMEVPCCSGTTSLVREALARSGKVVPVHDTTISLQGELIATK
ncbi:MAG: 4Fe-4S binding protein [Candidatus Aminicenantes bacterium]|nr:4Fe-4S binding protein [Candidatus Aminicenantes bacterium]